MTSLEVHQIKAHSAEYEDIASEYYDFSRHPTCWSLRQLSQKFLITRLRAPLPKSGQLIEMGAGLSILAPEASAQNCLHRVTLVDHSAGMLNYSSRWKTQGAKSLIAPADKTGLPDSSASVIVSSLGDPYNAPSFWKEVARILSPGGVCLFTTPSFEWASAFRTSEKFTVAEFLRSDGATLSMPSFIFEEERQLAMIEATGLKVVGRQRFGAESFEVQPAPKLLCVDFGTPVLIGYYVELRT